MKKYTFLIISMLLILVCGCNNNSSKNTTSVNYCAEEIMANIYNNYPIESDAVFLFDAIDYPFYNSLNGNIDSFFAVKKDGTKADEYIIIKTNSVDKTVKALEEYRASRLGDFNGYAPAEADKINKSEVLSIGSYVALFIADNSEEMNKYFIETMHNGFELSDDEIAWLESFLSEEISVDNTEVNDLYYTDEMNEENTTGIPRTIVTDDGQVLIEELKGYFDVYDGSNIVEAYKNNDISTLTDEKDIAVYNACKEIIENNISDDMTEYEKEKAIHDYLVQNANYDDNCLMYSNWYSEYSDQPYGCLVDKRAICLGYATTFKLFMDILDIECIVVPGSANDTYDNHGWNLVKLEDGNWYAVDVTWDDPVGAAPGEMYYTFFNVSDEDLLNNFHHWDEEKYPSATGGKYSNLENIINN